MNMQTYYILQLVEIFCAYFGVVLVLPYLALHKKLEEKRFSEQILFYFLSGNFYIMNLVFFLELLHISNRVTLILGTIVPFFVIAIRLNHWKVKSWIIVSFRSFQMMMGKRLGKKTVRYRLRAKFKKWINRQRQKWRIIPITTRFDFVVFAISFIAVIYFFGISIISVYGYSASDMPVHNYWINAFSENTLFVAGIYPEGAHCVHYYLHEVFGFDTYIVLSLMGFIQIVCVFYGALLFMKLCCKNRYLPYVGFFIYLAANVWSYNTYSRYYNALPQEYGMIFILPAVYYGFDFFRIQYKVVKESKAIKESNNEKKEKLASDEKGRKIKTARKRIGNIVKAFIRKEYFIPLCGFAMSFAMTFMVHFYNTMILGIICVAMAIAYLGLFVRKEFFPKIIITCFVGLFIAVLPMVICFALGTPLQGSLKWGMNVITGSTENSADTVEIVVNDNTGNTETEISDDSQTDNGMVTDNTVSTVTYENDLSESYTYTNQNSEEIVKKGFVARVKEKAEFIYSCMEKSVIQNVFRGTHDEYYRYLWLSILVLIVTGFISHLVNERCLGSMLWTIALSMVFHMILISSGKIGIPALMDTNRASIYTAYFIAVTVTIAIDSIFAIFVSKLSNVFTTGMNIIGFLFLLSVLFMMVDNKYVKEPRELGYLETNEAVTCLTNIIRTEPDFSWTILSANDELRMGYDHGYHYETITLLTEIEGLKNKEPVYIPTEKIFVFIEKHPINYGGGNDNDDAVVCEEKAAMELPPKRLQLAVYQKENRVICMSRIYYWMQSFIKMYPNDVKVYFEDDNFVCYEISQNTYRQFDLAIDYGFNTMKRDGEE